MSNKALVKRLHYCCTINVQIHSLHDIMLDCAMENAKRLFSVGINKAKTITNLYNDVSALEKTFIRIL